MLRPKRKYQKGGYSTQGYKRNSPDRDNPYNIIPGNEITMQGVSHPVFGISDSGDQRIMYPGEEHMFSGNQVLEIPFKSKNPYKKQLGGIKEAYDFLFGDDDESPKTPTAPSVDDIEQTQGRIPTQQDNSDYDIAMNIATGDSAGRNRFRERRSSYNPTTGTFDFTPDATYTTGDVQNEKEKYAFEWFKSRNIAPHVAAGIVGNLRQESGNFRDDVIAGKRTGDFGTAFGIAQWRNERKQGLEKFATSRGLNPYTFDAQLEFVLHEGTQRGDIQAAHKAKDAGEAAVIFAKRYERPKTIDPYRIKYAKQLYP